MPGKVWCATSPIEGKDSLPRKSMSMNTSPVVLSYMKQSSVLNSKRQFKNFLNIVSFALLPFYDAWASKFITTGSLDLSKHLLKKIPQEVTWICAWYGFKHDIIIIWRLLLSILMVPSEFTLPLCFSGKLQLNIMTVLKK